MRNKLLEQFEEAQDFLENHPALACMGTTPHVQYSFLEKTFNKIMGIKQRHKYENMFVEHAPYKIMGLRNVCKNGYDLEMCPHTIYINKDNPRYEELEGMIGCEPKSNYIKTGVKKDEYSDSLEVDYHIYYGYPWKPIKKQVWLQCFYRRFVTESDFYKTARWESYASFELDIIMGDTLEEAVIEAAKKVKEVLGDFNNQNILPKWVSDYNEAVREQKYQKWKVESNDPEVLVKSMMNSMMDQSGPSTIFLSGAELNELWWQTHCIPKNIREWVGESKNKYSDVSLYLDEEKFKKKYSI